MFREGALISRFTDIEAAGAVDTMEPPVPQCPQRYDYYEVEQKTGDEWLNYCDPS
jgi:hypothetical protein